MQLNEQGGSHLKNNNSEDSPTIADHDSRWRERCLLLVLRLTGGIALLAFLAALMPEQWIVRISEELGIVPFPESPLTFYLARNLSLLYGFVGLTLLVLATDLPRYRPLVRYAAFGTLLFGGLQFIVDSMSGLIWWWTWGESGSTIAGGILVYWLQRTNTENVNLTQ